MTSFNELECFIFALRSYAMQKVFFAPGFELTTF